MLNSNAPSIRTCALALGTAALMSAGAVQPVHAQSQPDGQPSAFNRRASIGAQSRQQTRIMVYTTTMSAGAINVFVDDLVQGGLIRATDPGQECGARDAITVTVRPGYHKLYAEAAGKRASWGPVTKHVREGECYVWRLSGRGASAPASEDRVDNSRARVVQVAIWTRRSLNIERKDVFVDGRPLVPANWSFSNDPNECGRLPMYAVKDYRPGDSVLIEVRDARTSTVTTNRITVPNVGCYLYEIR